MLYSSAGFPALSQRPCCLLRAVYDFAPKILATQSGSGWADLLAQGSTIAKAALILVSSALMIGGTIADASAASIPRVTCSGELTNTRANGVTLGQCDLNFLPLKQMTEIENVCGIPGTVDSPAENQCRIRAVVSPDPSPAADHRKLYKVLEMWSVDKR